ncbi:MAG: UTP--glucose-1-phosphate uridylyltransferase GalU, partial [Caulobacterales bacterium]|uniref:UTP--glucose-1-phosphate uridylyltransferase GalU n=1 Tax=Glycocaulis sp. TaxID=1969725 RepID=UPI003FA02854
MSKKPVRKAVLPVAGLGTRVLPATKVMPKEMLPVFDRPAIHYVVDEARAAGIEHFVFVTGRNKDAIEDYFDTAYELEMTLEAKGKTKLLKDLRADLPLPGACSFVRQQAPLGLGHAVWCARDIVGDEPFAVLLPDMIMRAETPCLAAMVKAYGAIGGNVISVEEVPMEEVSSYGIVQPGERKGELIEMLGMVEKPTVKDAPSNLMISGRYILQPEIFDALEAQKPGAGGEIQLTDAMLKLMETSPFHALPFTGETFDTGSKTGYLRAAAA